MDRQKNLDYGYSNYDSDDSDDSDDSMEIEGKISKVVPTTTLECDEDFMDEDDFLMDQSEYEKSFSNIPFNEASRETETDLINRISIMNRGSLRKSYMQPMQPTPCNPQFSHRAGILACKVMFTVILFIAVMFYVLPGTAVCTESKIETDIGRDQCRNQCHNHMCCLETGPNTCANSVHCLNYMHCNILLNTEHGDDGVSPLSKSVEALCNPVLIQTIHGRRACHDVCKTHLCCFAKNENICAKNDLCEHYGACTILLQTTDGLADKQKMIKNKVDYSCDEDTIRSTNDGRKKCEELCAQKECCFESGHKYCKGLDCSLFDKCSNMQVVSFDEASIENISLKEASIENISVDNHPTGEGKDLDENIVNTISNLCSLSNLKSNIGKYQCSSVCNDHLCCVMDGRSNCTKGNEAICSKYSLCSNLFTSHSASTTCTVDNVKNEEGWIKCYERCASGMCCFNGRECPEDLDCTLYEDCTVLDVDENPVASVCTQENMIMLKAKNECKSYCDSKMCCLEDGGKNCPESVMDCEKYTPCAILL